MASRLEFLTKHIAAIGVAAVASTAFALFGFDTTVSGGVIALKSFQVDFKLSTNAVKSANISSNVVALLNSGAFFGALFPALLSQYVGRKFLMAIAACFMILGGTLQTAAQPPSLSMIYGGRVISGIGVGLVSSFAPMYIAETAPKQFRGALMSFTELSLVLGSMVAYWAVYGCSLHLKPTSKQWRVPLSLQIIIGTIILVGSFIIVESPRWLAKQDRWDEAINSLRWLRNASDEELKVELAEIHAQIEEEIKATSGRSLKELFQRQNLFRLLWACGIMMLAVGTGQTAIIYYAPTVFKQIGFTGQNSGLLASGVVTVVKVIVTILFLTLLVQNFKRKHLLLFGSALMCIMLFTLGALLKTHPTVVGHSVNSSSSGRAMMATIYLFFIGYTISWGPLSWVYVGEIFPARIRDYGTGIAVMTIWFFNFVISKWTPLMFLHLNWKTWMLFGTFNALAFIFAIFLPETKGLSLEEMDILFGVVDESTRRLDIEEHLGTTETVSAAKYEPPPRGIRPVTMGKYPSFDLFSDPPPPNLTEFQEQYVRNFDWGLSPLGFAHDWPLQLRQMVNIIQRDIGPSCIYWDIPGKESTDVAIVYNEAYTSLIGQKHPSLQGSDPKYGFAEVWDQFAQLLERARQTGDTVEDKNCFLLLERHGFLEETYFSWKFMPVVGPEGHIVGSYATVVESTMEVIAARRLATIQHLGQMIVSSLPYHGNWGTVLTGLAGSKNDIPLALLYSVTNKRATPPLAPRDASESDGCYCYLEGRLGVETDHPIAPRLVDIGNDSESGWAAVFRKSMEINSSYLVLDVGDKLLPAELFDGISWRGFDIPSKQVVVCPIRSPTTSTILSFLVIALNPRRPYDKAYEDWIELLIKSIATPHVEAVTAAADSAQLSKRLLIQTKNLRESEKKFLHFARRSTVGILILDPDGNLLFGNSAWFDLIMAKASSREQYNNAIHPDDLALRNSKWAEMLRDKLPVNYQLRFNKPWKPPPSLGIGAAETCTFTLIFMWPDVDSDGNIQSVMATATDISEMKFIEDQLRQKSLDAEQRVKQQEAFVDMVSHEIRNPLSAILHCADEISSSLTKQMTHSNGIDETHNLIQAADTISYCAMHQKRIVDDILTLSKLDSNLLEVAPQPAEPIDLVETALKMFESELKKLNMQLQLVVDQSIRDLHVHWLLFDSNRVLQVLVNLMTNAVKFTRDSPHRRDITVTLAASLEPPPDTDGGLTYVPSMDKKLQTPSHVWCDWPPEETVFLSCSVSDTGKGITKKELKGLFHRFSQASPKTQVQYGGSGLGLYISRQLSEMQGGKIGVKSEYGVGSTFTFYIRTCRTSVPETDLKMQVPDFGRMKEELSSACGSGTGISDINEPSTLFSKLSLPDTVANISSPDDNHILIVEDNLVNQKVLAKQLRNHGYRVSVANHGLECLSFLESTTFWTANNNVGESLVVILMDWEMPVMDGLTCVKKIRELEREGKINAHIPVVAVTANARSQQRVAAEEAGMDDIVTKPYRVSEILEQISGVLERLRPQATIGLMN